PDPLEQEPGGADPQRLVEVLLVVVHGEEHDLAGRAGGQDVAAQVEPGRAAQPHVEQDRVRVQAGHQAHRLARVAGLADHLHLLPVRAEHGLETVEDHLMVIDDHQAHRARRAAIHSPNGTHAVPPGHARASSRCHSSSNWAMASASLRLPAAYSPSVSGGAVPWSNDSCSQMAFSTILLSSRGACPCTCSASTGRPSASLISFRCTVRRSSSVRTWHRSGWPMVGRRVISADSEVPSPPGRASSDSVPDRLLRPATGANLMAMSAHWRCGRMNAAESGSRRSSSASTSPGVYPRSAQSRLIFHFRLISSGGSRYTVMSKQARASLVCSGSRPSTITNSRGSTSTGRTSEPVEWSYTGLRMGRPSASNCRCCSITSM